MENKITFYSVQDAEDFLLNDSLNVSYYLYSIIKNMIEYKQESDVLFHLDINGTNLDMIIYDSNLSKPLKKCLEVFERYEDYENCTKCLELLNML